MARGRAPRPAEPVGPPTSPKFLFRSTRQILWFTLFALYFCLTAAELGLVSEQMHKHGNDASGWPNLQLKNAFGLLLFNCIFSLLFVLGHWALGLGIHTFVFFAMGVFWGTTSGILYNTPFGQGWRLQCWNDINSFPANYRPFVPDCTRWTAVHGLSWALFGLSVIGLFATLVDRFEFHTKRTQMYDLEAHTDEEKAAINRLPSRTGSEAHSHAASAAH